MITAQAQAGYNQLHSAIQYLIWMTDPKDDQEYKDREDARMILREAKRQVEDENNWQCNLELGWQYADKWEEIYYFGNAIKKQIKQVLKPVLGYF